MADRARQPHADRRPRLPRRRARRRDPAGHRLPLRRRGGLRLPAACSRWSSRACGSCGRCSRRLSRPGGPATGSCVGASPAPMAVHAGGTVALPSTRPRSRCAALRGGRAGRALRGALAPAGRGVAARPSRSSATARRRRSVCWTARARPRELLDAAVAGSPAAELVTGRRGGWRDVRRRDQPSSSGRGRRLDRAPRRSSSSSQTERAGSWTSRRAAHGARRRAISRSARERRAPRPLRPAAGASDRLRDAERRGRPRSRRRSRRRRDHPGQARALDRDRQCARPRTCRRCRRLRRRVRRTAAAARARPGETAPRCPRAGARRAVVALAHQRPTPREASIVDADARRHARA